MPTILLFYGIRVSVNPRDHNPPHCHVVGRGGAARYDLRAKAFMDSTGFTRSDLATIEQQILMEYETIMNVWMEFHGEK